MMNTRVESYVQIVAILAFVCVSAHAMYDIGVFKFDAVQKVKKNMIYMNKLRVKSQVISKFQSGSFLQCVAQCHVAEGCYAVLYKDKECTKSRLPSPQIGLGSLEGLHKAYSHIPLDVDWVIIQRRIDATTDFFRGWQEYVEGFGDFKHNFWLGLEKIHQLTNMGATAELHIYVETFSGEEFYASYDHFSVGDASSGFALSISGYKGTAGDSLISSSNPSRVHNGMKFSTFDNDQDMLAGINCASDVASGWWFNGCYCSNLNGVYEQGKWEGVVWYTAKGSFESLKTAIMKIRVKSV